MKQYKLIAAYNVIKSMNSTGMKGISLATQLKMYNLQKQLTPAYEFQIEKEKAIFEEYPPTKYENGSVIYEKEDGTPDVEKVRACQKLIDELNNLENDSIKIEPIHISLKEAESLKSDLDINIMEAIDGILIIDMDDEPQIQLVPISSEESSQQ